MAISDSIYIAPFSMTAVAIFLLYSPYNYYYTKMVIVAMENDTMLVINNLCTGTAEVEVYINCFYDI